MEERPLRLRVGDDVGAEVVVPDLPPDRDGHGSPARFDDGEAG